jgi:drug/metabolite transporter (DMT)-like permease
MRRFLPAVAAAATGIQVGAAIVATRFVIGETAPASLALLRYAIGLLCLVPPLALAQRVRIAQRDLAPIGLLGIVQFGVLIALLNYGLSLVPSARAALIFATFPLLTVVVATILGEERPTAAKTVGVLLTIVGVALAIGERGVGPGHATGEWLGELAILSSALAGAICSVLYRPYLRKYPALPVSAIAMLASVGFLALLAAGEGFFNALPQFTRDGWLAVLFIGVSSGVGYYLWLWALGRTTPTRVTVFLGLSPITATALGASFLGEPVSLMLAGGLACVVLGLWIAHREPTTGLR